MLWRQTQGSCSTNEKKSLFCRSLKTRQDIPHLNAHWSRMRINHRILVVVVVGHFFCQVRRFWHLKETHTQTRHFLCFSLASLLIFYHTRDKRRKKRKGWAIRAATQGQHQHKFFFLGRMDIPFKCQEFLSVSFVRSRARTYTYVYTFWFVLFILLEFPKKTNGKRRDREKASRRQREPKKKSPCWNLHNKSYRWMASQTGKKKKRKTHRWRTQAKGKNNKKNGKDDSAKKKEGKKGNGEQ